MKHWEWRKWRRILRKQHPPPPQVKRRERQLSTRSARTSGRCYYPARQEVSILLLDSAGTSEVMRWNLIGAWVSSWRGAVLDALSQEVAIESVTIVYEYFQRA